METLALSGGGRYRTMLYRKTDFISTADVARKREETGEEEKKYEEGEKEERGRRGRKRSRAILLFRRLQLLYIEICIHTTVPAIEIYRIHYCTCAICLFP